MGAHSLGDHFMVHTFGSLWLMCYQLRNICSQRKKMKCEVDLGSQNNLDVWSNSEHIMKKNINKFWLKQMEDKIDKLIQGLKLIRIAPSWSKFKWDRGETTN